MKQRILTVQENGQPRPSTSLTVVKTIANIATQTVLAIRFKRNTPDNLEKRSSTEHKI